MAKRFYRELSDETKQKISNSMKKFHKNNDEVKKQQTSQKQSRSMQDYWRHIPHKRQSGNNATIEDIML